MSSTFHLAIPVRSILEAEKFYCDLLGCQKGNYEAGKWQDINFWGNELTLHEADHGLENERHDVDMGRVCVPHFGIHLSWENYLRIKSNVEKSIGFFDQPYTRFKDLETEQETFFVEDTNYNVIEIKSVKGSYYNNKKYN